VNRPTRSRKPHPAPKRSAAPVQNCNRATPHGKSGRRNAGARSAERNAGLLRPARGSGLKGVRRSPGRYRDAGCRHECFGESHLFPLCLISLLLDFDAQLRNLNRSTPMCIGSLTSRGTKSCYWPVQKSFEKMRAKSCATATCEHSADETSRLETSPRLAKCSLQKILPQSGIF
jgi:hypothetical protein